MFTSNSLPGRSKPLLLAIPLKINSSFANSSSFKEYLSFNFSGYLFIKTSNSELTPVFMENISAYGTNNELEISYENINGTDVLKYYYKLNFKKLRFPYIIFISVKIM